MDKKTKFLIINLGIALMLQFGIADTAHAAKNNSKKSSTSKGVTVMGSAKDDRLKGGGGDDKLYGKEGDDNMGASVGNDYLEGGPGTDKMWGGPGDDVFYGGPGPDKNHGDKGNDVYVYKSVSDAPYSGTPERWNDQLKKKWEIIKPSEPGTNAFDGQGKAKGDLIDLRAIGKLEFGKHITVHDKWSFSQVLVDVNLDKKPDMEIMIYDSDKVKAKDYSKEDFLLSNK